MKASTKLKRAYELDRVEQCVVSHLYDYAVKHHRDGNWYDYHFIFEFEDSTYEVNCECMLNAEFINIDKLEIKKHLTPDKYLQFLQ